MNCPFCKQEQPENNATGICRHCGQKLKPETPRSEELPPVKISWLWIFVAFIAPPLLTLLSATLSSQKGNGGAPIAIALFGSGLGGLASGIILGLKLGKTAAIRVVLSMVFAVVFIVACFVLSFIGCAIGGFQLDMK